MNKILIGALKLWNGNERLALSFWGVFIPVILLTQVAKLLLASLNVFMPAVLLLFLVLITLKIFSIVSVWRCAFNISSDLRFLGWAARVIAIASIIPIVFFVLIIAV